jgi:hypothetical protein
MEGNTMRTPKKIAAGISTLGMLLCIAGLPKTAQAQQMTSTKSQRSTQQKIDLALSAGPSDISKNATVAEPDGHGGMKILRQGTNDFTCMPGDPSGVGMPAMCMDKVAMQWNKDFEEHKPKPTTTVPGIEYMLAGATQRSDSDPNDKTSPAIKIGPHWMILWPFDPKTTGLPTTHRATGAYIMWAGSPYAHVHVMGRP